jgi:hypothetical protein
MIGRSRAAVVASVFHVAIHFAAWSPNSTRPACGETNVPRDLDVSISARNAVASFLIRNVLDRCLSVRSRKYGGQAIWRV